MTEPSATRYARLRAALGDRPLPAVLVDLAAFDANVSAALRAVADRPVRVRVGSQTLQTVLFVNGQQVGVVGGRGLVGTTVVPGPVQIQVKRQGCRDWDTTFTGVAGKRYTLEERSPRC